MLLLACAPQQPRIEVHAEPDIDLAAYSSWNFVEPLQLDRVGTPAVYGDAFRRHIEAVMTQRGYRRAGEPELVIDVAAAGDDGPTAALANDPVQAIHPQRGTFYSGWRGYGQGQGSQSQARRISDAAFSMGLVDIDGNRLVWEGVASGRLGGQRSDAEVEALVERVVNEVMTAIPARRID